MKKIPLFEIAKPLQTVIVTCRGEAEVLGIPSHKDNAITLDWHMPVSVDPPLYAISVGKTRFSHDIIAKSGVYCVNFMSLEDKAKVIYCGTHSGQTVDKFKETGMKRADSRVIDCPRLKDAMAYLECEVINQVDAGDHTIFIGQIKHSRKITQGKRILHLGKLEFSTTDW